MFKKLTLFRGLSCVFAVLLIVMILAANMLERNKVMVDQTLGTKSTVIETTYDGELYKAFTPDEDYLDENGKLSSKSTDLHTKLYLEMGREGFVLLKNENNTLPLASNQRNVTVFGRRSYSTVTNALTAARFIDGELSGPNPYGFSINNVIQSAYGSNPSQPTGTTAAPPLARNKTYQKADPNEGSADWLAGRISGGLSAAQTSFAAFPDAAIVTLGRNAAEGPDYEASANGVLPDSGAKNPMDLYASERSIIKLATDNFSKVIILINATQMIELGDLKDDPKVGAILWFGSPGGGVNAIGDIIAGEVNPSGGLYSTYARDSLSAPALRNTGGFYWKNWMDMGEGIPNPGTEGTGWGKFMRGPNYPGSPDVVNGVPGGQGYYGDLPIINKANKKGGRVDTGNPNTNGTDAGLEAYLMEAENIYIGYRYFETRYYDSVMGDVGAKSSAGVYRYSGGWDYKKEMAYTFGFGLSYTTFQFTMGEPTFTKRGLYEVMANVPVTVKNMGTVAGKTPVQVYGQSPYTQYDKTNAVEKSAVQLLNFEKTKLLNPQEEQTINVQVDLQNLASYDYKNAKTYIMDVSPDYYFAVGNGAHDALNNILAAQGRNPGNTGNVMTYAGRATAAKKWSYDHPVSNTNIVDSTTFSYSKSGTKITNRLEGSHFNDYQTGVVTELTRNNWGGTFPKTYANMTITAPQKLMDHVDGKYFEIKDTDKVTDVTWGAKNGLKFGDMKGASFDDNRWPDLLDQLTIEEAIQGTIQGGRGFADMPSIGFPGGSYSENGPGNPVTLDSGKPAEEQAPWKLSSYSGVSRGSAPAESVMASTFNPELSKEWGRLTGNDSVFAEKPILWMPGTNLHRHGYNGRMHLYYSEDPILTGMHSMEMVVGALEKGAIVCSKHLAFNDQEFGRYGVGAFMTEQRARELELRAYQIAFEANKYDEFDANGKKIKDVGMMGTMTAFNKLGGIELTCHKGILTYIMRGEWGFNGYVVSDLKDDLDLMRQGCKAGMTGWDWRLASDDIAPYDDTELWSKDKELMEAMKFAIKRDLWVFANSHMMNSVNSSSYSRWNMTWWRQVYISGITISSVFLAACAAMYVTGMILQRKKGGN